MIAKHCTQTCVFWGSPQDDGEGGKTFAAPVQLSCRWEDMHQIITDAKGTEMTSRALVFLLQDVDEEGMLYLGTLADLNSADEENPMSVDGAYIIKRFQKTPSLGSTTDFLRKAYLTPSLSFGGF